jgi:tetratricopeptide (TPR) repeat protein
MVEWVDNLVFAKTGDRLSELQLTILSQVCQAQPYTRIADFYGCTEGHAKDVGSDLWKQLSELLNDKVTKKNLRLILSRHCGSALPAQKPVDKPVDKGDIQLQFLGREATIAHLQTASRNAKIIVLQGEGGIGKTTLAQHYLQQQSFELVLECLMAKESQNITPVQHIVEEWLKQDFQEEPSLEFGITLKRLKRHLLDRRIGILIDNLETALNHKGLLDANHQSYVELLRVLSDPRIQGLTLITSRDRLCEPSITVYHYRLPGLELKAWEQYLTYQGIQQQDESLRAMHRAYGGNAKAMELLSSAIREDEDGNLEAFWQKNQRELLVLPDLQNLVDSQLQRLQILDPQAYKLFYRLGCYRYQTISRIPQEGVLALLWDIPEQERRRSLLALQNRSLLELRQGEYFLHPVLHEAAVQRLRKNGDWQCSHEVAAEFWSDSIQQIQSTQDALCAMESYYHYSAIQAFSKASRVILKSRPNQWGQVLPLGSTLYRMGLLQPLLESIPQILPHLEEDYTLSELYNLLGDVYWITGKVQDAIACQKQSLQLVIQAQSTLTDESTEQSRYYFKMLEVDSLLSIGLYNIDLWELESASKAFTQVIQQATNTAHHRWAEKATVCLAMVQSYLGNIQGTKTLLKSTLQAESQDASFENRGSFAYFLQLLAQTYVNLKEFNIAHDLYQKALSFSATSHYKQLKGNCWVGLTELYREQGEIEKALETGAAAIELLEDIGAICDLAEAHLQLGLTYLKSVQKDKASRHLSQAQELFATINAPKQIQKVADIFSTISPEPFAIHPTT